MTEEQEYSGIYKMTVMQHQLTKIVLPSTAGIKSDDTEGFFTEVQFRELGFTDLVDITSILTPEEKLYVSEQGSALGSLFIESLQTGEKFLVPMKTITSDGVRESRVPRGFTPRTVTVEGQRGLVGFPTVAGG